MGPSGKISRRGFTLIELLVVVAIIVVLISILLPSLGRAREQAKMVACGSNLRQIGIAMEAYASEWTGYFPAIDNTNDLTNMSYPRNGMSWDDALWSYLGGTPTENFNYPPYDSNNKFRSGLKVFQCPADIGEKNGAAQSPDFLSYYVNIGQGTPDSTVMPQPQKSPRKYEHLAGKAGSGWSNEVLAGPGSVVNVLDNHWSRRQSLSAFNYTQHYWDNINWWSYHLNNNANGLFFDGHVEELKRSPDLANVSSNRKIFYVITAPNIK